MVRNIRLYCPYDLRDMFGTLSVVENRVEMNIFISQNTTLKPEDLAKYSKDDIVVFDYTSKIFGQVKAVIKFLD